MRRLWRWLPGRSVQEVRYMETEEPAIVTGEGVARRPRISALEKLYGRDHRDVGDEVSEVSWTRPVVSAAHGAACNRLTGCENEGSPFVIVLRGTFPVHKAREPKRLRLRLLLHALGRVPDRVERGS